MNYLRHELINELDAGASGRVFPEWNGEWNLHIADERSGIGRNRGMIGEGGGGSRTENRLSNQRIDLVSLRRAKVSEWLDGGVTMRQLVHRHLLVVGDFVKVARILLEDLEEIHKAGGVHGDIQPCKVKFHNSLRGWICGAGLQKSELESASGECKKHLVGSLCFMAPELYSGGRHDEQTDMYALGCLFYYMLTGCVPFYGETAVEMMISHTVGVYVPLDKIRNYMDKDLASWVERCFYKEREQRFASCAEALKELAAFSELTDYDAFDLELGQDLVKRVAPITSRSICPAHGRIEMALDTLALEADEHLPAAPPKVEVLEKICKESAICPASGKMGSCPVVPVRITEESLAVVDRDCWFAMVDGLDVGPMSLDYLGSLILEGKLNREDYIWRAGWSDWRHTDECDEAGEYLCQRRIQLQMAQEMEQEKEAERVQLCSGIFNCELLVAALTAVAALLCMYAVPEKWEMIMSTYAMFLMFVGFVGLKAIEGATGVRWLLAGLILPIVADIYFVMRRKKVRLQSFALMALGALLVGAMHLNV